ncbi:PTS fructose transporter subunit IIB [Virgibacillus sp. NKC19-3]|uniref:PTS fructose transporter subunit IIB n=1 Tax=Virgibacillus saliphilus TaxID=2831674 RepID=UPI001C9B75E9|nr:PTS fructose transporter subunit IIB [Virgibacillus sp. NKC19-3]MBY7141745.1 PTS fructose transporter subunit IIB [Virgibacillus sp. NKC19-3]
MTKIVAVTACITGVAHTFMAKSNLEKYAKKEGYDIKVETQGGMGVENRLSQSEVDDADVVILAADTKVVDKERFDSKKIVQVGTSEVVKNGKKVIEDAINKVEV